MQAQAPPPLRQPRFPAPAPPASVTSFPSHPVSSSSTSNHDSSYAEHKQHRLSNDAASSSAVPLPASSLFSPPPALPASAAFVAPPLSHLVPFPPPPEPRPALPAAAVSIPFRPYGAAVPVPLHRLPAAAAIARPPAVLAAALSAAQHAAPAAPPPSASPPPPPPSSSAFHHSAASPPPSLLQQRSPAADRDTANDRSDSHAPSVIFPVASAAAPQSSAAPVSFSRPGWPVAFQAAAAPARSASPAPAAAPSAASHAASPLSPSVPAVGVLSSARRALLIAKALRHRHEREQKQKEEMQRLAALQASLLSFSASATSNLPSSSYPSSAPLTHPLDGLIAVDDSLHSRYVLESAALDAALCQQQDCTHQLSLLIAQLQEAVAPLSSSVPVPLSASYYQTENALLRDYIQLLQRRLEQRAAEAEQLLAMLQRKSSRVHEVREEAAVVAEEMRGMLRRLGLEKDRREQEMREEREAAQLALRSLIDRCVRENEWMRLRLRDEDREALEAWKAEEEDRTEARERESRQLLKREQQREKERGEERQQRPRDKEQSQEQAMRFSEKEERKLPYDETRPSPIVSVFPTAPSAAAASRSPASIAATMKRGQQRVHFRYPSASPVVRYSPALSSSPSSPLQSFASPALQLQQRLPPSRFQLPPSPVSHQPLGLVSARKQRQPPAEPQTVSVEPIPSMESYFTERHGAADELEALLAAAPPASDSAAATAAAHISQPTRLRTGEVRRQGG